MQIIEEVKAGDSYSLAARLWPHWRTRRGNMTAASEGKAFQILRSLQEKGLIDLRGNAFCAIGQSEESFQLRSEA